jgi:peptide deformylase
VASYELRFFGDPGLRRPTEEVTSFDGALAQLAEDMVATMYRAEGVGLAANQIGVRKRVFVYDVGDGPEVVVNPRITESRGEFTYEEGCLSVPKLYWPIVRADEVYLTGQDLNGNELAREGSEKLGRVFLHEVDHLDGVLLLEHLDEEQRREAMKVLRSRTLGLAERPAAL